MPERNPASRSRASASSSTTSVRIPGIRLLGGDDARVHRKPETDLRPASEDAADLGQMRGTVGAREPVAQVAEADAALVHALERRARHAEAVVADGEIEAAVADGGIDGDRPGAALPREAVLHGVLHERLEDQVGDELVEAAGVDARLDAEPLA